MLPTQGFWLPKGVPFLEFFCWVTFQMPTDFESHVNHLFFLLFASIPGIFITFSQVSICWCGFDVIGSHKWPKIQVLGVFLFLGCHGF